MGSLAAMEAGSAERYGQAVPDEGVLVESNRSNKLVPEGIEGRVPYKGSLAAMVHQLVGGLRSGMGYCGSRTVAEFREKARFVKISSAGLRESHVHDVIITKEAPNYRREMMD
jgi:IMP dehydrogenase